ncbi:MAG: N-acetylneuraminate synthase family protein [Oscillibacter sp.]|nr:N-acetylneuraminate synthase family protein [Oscillibacter sp.]
MGKITLNNGREISDYGKPYIIAELGANHNGDMELARELIRKAKEAGCDCVKFQSWTKNTVFSKKVYEENHFLNDDYRNRTDYTLKEIVDKFSVSDNELYSMAQYCREIGIDFSSTPFSKHEVDFLADTCHTSFIKVASMDLNNYPFLRYIARKQLPVVLSTGLSTDYEVAKAVETIEREGNRQIVLLHCISIYPPAFEDINLQNIVGLRYMYPEYPIGFSDHSLGVEIPTAAVALGACVIEKHFTLDKGMFGWDHKISADPEEMCQLVQTARNVHLSLGSTRRIVSKAEYERRDAFRRSIVAARDLEAGHVLTEEDLDLKRPGTGIAPEKLDDLLGRKLTRAVSYDEMLTREDFT